MIEKNVYFQNLNENVNNQNAIAFAEMLARGDCLYEINQYLITGPSGSGKTKLLFAIATEAGRQIPYSSFVPIYIKASTFIREYRYAVDNFKLPQMRQEYVKLKKCIFMIDDINLFQTEMVAFQEFLQLMREMDSKNVYIFTRNSDRFDEMKMRNILRLTPALVMMS